MRPANEQPLNAKKETSYQPIFGLRYLEEEAADIYDVVGCYQGGTSDGRPQTLNMSGSCDLDED
jgi:hypothetical protein